MRARLVALGRSVRGHFSALDLALLLVAFALGWCTLLYPFGRDQGLYHFVGREWLTHGAVPYRDYMDQKTPGIYLIFGVARLLFGERFASIRVLELGFVLTVGFVLGSNLGAHLGVKGPHGLGGLGAVTLSTCYFVQQNFWDSAQCEVWSAGFSLLGLAVLLRDPSRPARQYAAGVLCIAGVLAKIPGLAMAGVVGLCALERGLVAGTGLRGRALGATRSSARFLLGFLGPFAALLLYLWASGALPDTYDVLVRCNAYYLEHEMETRTKAEMLAATVAGFRDFHPLTALAFGIPAVGMALGALGRSYDVLRRYALCLLMVLAALAGIAIQRKFWSYHWTLWLVACALPVCMAAAELTARFRRDGREGHTRLFALAMALVVLVAASSTGPRANLYLRTATAAWDMTQGRVTRAQFYAVIARPTYDLEVQHALADWLAAHSSPDDEVAMRNFEPAVYLLAHRRTRLRFFWTPWIAWRERSYRREDWLAQDRAQFATLRPRFIVAVRSFTEGPESPNYYEPGYVRRFETGNFTVMERVPGLGTAATRPR